MKSSNDAAHARSMKLNSDNDYFHSDSHIVTLYVYMLYIQMWWPLDAQAIKTRIHFIGCLHKQAVLGMRYSPH